MKKFLLLLSIMTVLMCSCQKGDVDTDLKGKTFVYDNGERGTSLIRETFKFEKNGNVYHKSEVGATLTFDTEDCSLYYKMDATIFTIYYGTKGWKKEVQNTVYRKGEYHTDYLMIDGLKYNRQ